MTNLGHKKWAKKVFEEALELVKENEDKDQIEDIKKRKVGRIEIAAIALLRSSQGSSQAGHDM